MLNAGSARWPLPLGPERPRRVPRTPEEGKGGRGAEAVSPPVGLRDHPALGVGARPSALLLTAAHKALAAGAGRARLGGGLRCTREEGQPAGGLTMKSRAKLSSPLWSGLFMAWTLWMNFLRISTCSILPRSPGCGRWPPWRRPPARRRARSVFPSSLPLLVPSLPTPANPRRSLLLPTAQGGGSGGTGPATDPTTSGAAAALPQYEASRCG